ncbi:MAG: N-carbamoyl-D-amino-acid hydrolase [Thalassobaculales bacterium]
MPRILTIGAAQMGPIARTETRAQVVERLIAQLEAAAARGCDLAVFPELSLTTFFPRWFMADWAEVDAWFERAMPGPDTEPLFAAARRLKIGFHLGYAELTAEGRRFNTAILVGKDGAILGKYRKIHLPGHAENEPWRAFQHLEKRYFEVGDLGFRVFDAFGARIGMAICNDRRWPETYRCLALQGAEVILIGYNTPVHNPPAPDHDRLSWQHNALVLQAGAYQNACWVVGVAKAGPEEGVPMIGGSQIVAPSGEAVALCVTDGDELVTYACDLDMAQSYRRTTFNFALHRQPQAYTLVTATRGPVTTAQALAIEGRTAQAAE